MINLLRKPFIKSLLLHAVVLIFLMINLSFNNNDVNIEEESPVEAPILATAFSSDEVNKEIFRIEQEEVKHKLALKHDQDRIALQSKKMRQELSKIAKNIKAKENDLKKIKRENKLQKLENIKNKDLASIDKQLDNEMNLLEVAEKNKARLDSEIQKFRLLLKKRMSNLWISQQQFLGKNLSTVLELKLDQAGKVVSSKIYKSSGSEALDLSVKMAANKLEKIEIPNDPELYKLINTVHFTFKPDE